MLLIHRCQRGFTTVTMMGVLMVGGLLVAASFAAVQPDIRLTQQDDDSKQAYAAAEAGINYYMNRLSQDNGYYTKCNQVPSPTENAVNLEWTGTGADPRVYRKIPGYKAEYAVELLAVQTSAAGTELCTINVPESMINPKTGTFRIRSTGRARSPKSATDKPPKRSIIATLRRKSFIDFLYFTKYETLDPSAYPTSGTTYDADWAALNCVKPRAQRHSQCQEISFLTVDSLEGPFHSDDSLLICGSPTIGLNPDDVIEINGVSPGWDNSPSCSASPNFKGTVKYPGGILPMPQTNAELKAAADEGYVFQGETVIRLTGNTMTVNGGPSIPLPPSGVIYAENTACGGGYKRQNMLPFPLPNTSPGDEDGCGNIYVQGTYNKDLTIGADNDIIVTDDLISANKDTILGGLIANNFVRVYHPVTFGSGPGGCTNNGGPLTIRIDAAILALNHSFIADNWYCGDKLGTLTVNGAIAQRFRGTVSTFSGGSVVTGYAKDYNYNRTLRYREPPYFIAPTESAWRIVRQNEQVPAR